MGERDQFYSYCATLIAIVVVVVATLAFTTFSSHVFDKIESLGIGIVLGGLIGALRGPSRGSVTVDNPPNNPVPVEPAK